MVTKATDEETVQSQRMTILDYLEKNDKKVV